MFAIQYFSFYLCVNISQRNVLFGQREVFKTSKFTNMSLQELINSGQTINITIGLSDLQKFATDLISQTKNDLEADLIAAKSETYLTRLEACEHLQVDQSTLFRWAKRGYLLPIEVGGKRMYRMSDLKRILNGGTDK